MQYNFLAAGYNFRDCPMTALHIHAMSPSVLFMCNVRTIVSREWRLR